MKIRNGFVSNSSSSSFIVRFKNHPHRNRSDSMIATEEDIRKLTDYGFQLSRIENPFDVDSKIINLNEEKYLGFISALKYKVDCNQDIVIAFLLKNKIPFRASIHYGNDFYQYNRGDDDILVAHNSGQVLAMYGADEESVQDEEEIPSISRKPVKSYERDYHDEPIWGDFVPRAILNAEYVIKMKNTPYGEDIENEN